MILVMLIILCGQNLDTNRFSKENDRFRLVDVIIVLIWWYSQYGAIVNASCTIEYLPCGLLLNEALECQITNFSTDTCVQ